MAGKKLSFTHSSAEKAKKIKTEHIAKDPIVRHSEKQKRGTLSRSSKGKNITIGLNAKASAVRPSGLVLPKVNTVYHKLIIPIMFIF